MKILVLEASTSSAKAMVFDSRLGIQTVDEVPYGPSNTGTLHDVDDVASTLVGLGKRTAAKYQIHAVALVGAWHGLCAVTPDMKPASQVFLWSNTEAKEITDRLRSDEAFVGRFYRRTGCMVNATYPIFELLLLHGRGMDLTNMRFLDEGTYLNWLLTGEYIQTECMASGTGLMDLRTRTWAPELLEFAGVREDQLPRIVESTYVSALTDRGAQLLGLEEGTPVIPTNSDGGLNQVAASDTSRSVMSFSVGTSGAMRMSVEVPRFAADLSTWCYISPESWISGAATAGAGNCMNWFITSVGQRRWTHAELDSMASDVTDPPLFLPFMFGERCPGWLDNRMGGFAGLRSDHGIAEMYQAVREGVLFNLRQCYESLVHLNGEPECIKISGGILKSRSWTQMAADVVGRELEIDRTLHSSMYGGAKNALRLLEGWDSKRLLNSEEPEQVCPKNERVELFDRRYQHYLAEYALTSKAKGK
ncbi:gluconokinase [Arcanobacterium haemolyticum]|nr:gluconokinase [Arcanobacterium haemolyticum]